MTAAARPIRCCWIVLNDVVSPVLGSQVLAPLGVYSRCMPDVEFQLLFVDAARRVVSRRNRAAMRVWRSCWSGGRIRQVPHIGRLGGRGLRAAVEFALPRGAGPLILHCRAPDPVVRLAPLARRLGARLVFDARGSSELEAPLVSAESGRDRDPAAASRAVENGRRLDEEAWRAADAVTAVSGRLLRHLELLGGPSDRVRVVIPPSVARMGRDREARARVRRSLGLAPDTFALVHTSSEARWEDYGRVLRIFREVLARGAAHLSFVTTVPEARVLATLAPEDPLRRHLDVGASAPDRVQERLAAADAALLVRRPEPALDLTVPAKLPEYLAAGLPVAISAGCGEAADLVHEVGAGVLLCGDDAADGRSVDALRGEGGREAGRAAAALCRERFLWEAHVPTLRRLYGIEVPR